MQILRIKTRLGFSLVELMVVVAIIGVLSALAIPNYQQHVQKTRRSDATIALSQAATAQEKWFYQYGGYSNNVNDIGGNEGVMLSLQQHYRVSIDNKVGQGNCIGGDGVAFNCYTLIATPVAGGAQNKDSACSSFSLAHTGLRSATGSLGISCWR